MSATAMGFGGGWDAGYIGDPLTTAWPWPSSIQPWGPYYPEPVIPNPTPTPAKITFGRLGPSVEEFEALKERVRELENGRRGDPDAALRSEDV